MQRCPKCYRTYSTETQKFCTACGGRLITDDGAETTPSLRETYATFVNTNPSASTPANFDPQQTVVTPPALPSAPLDPQETVTMRPAPPPPAEKFDPLKTFNPSPAANVRPPNPDLEVTMLGPSTNLSFDKSRPTAESLGEGVKTNSVLPPSASLKTTALNPASTRFEAATPPPVTPPAPSVTPAPPVTPPTVKPVPTPPAPSVPLVASAPLAPPVPTPAPPVPVATSAPLAPPVPTPAPPVPAQVAVPVRPPVVAAPPVKRSKVPLILGLAAILLLGVIGAGVLAYLFVIKPRLAARQQPPTIVTAPEPPAPPPVTDKTDTPPALSGKKVPPVTIAPPNAAKFVNDRAQTTGKLAEHFVDFSFYYPKAWIAAPTKGTNNFAEVSRKSPDGLPQELFTASWYESQGTFAADEASFATLATKKSADLEKSLPPSGYRKTDEGPTNVNGAEAYQFRFQGQFNGNVPYWGRVIFLPSGETTNKNGVTLFLLATAKATEVTSLEEVGVKGELPVILNTFRLGPVQ